MAGTARLGRVVANFCAVLMAKEQFDRGVAVQYPIGTQGIKAAFTQRGIHPCGALVQLGLTFEALVLCAVFTDARCQGFQGSAQALVTDDAGHPQYLWRHGITPQSIDVGVAALAVKNRE